jgi:hypothetical protein
MSASQSRASAPSLTLVELNEFDPDFLRRSAGKLGLRRIPEFLDMPHTHTTTDDEVEHQGLDPWVQWVNVHTGQPSAAHGILRLGQTARQTQRQLWSAIGDRGHSWGVWGAMNAPQQDASGRQFFFPDPWSFEERAYPERLNELLALPRYMAKNYLEADRAKVLREALRFASALVTPSLWSATARFSSAMAAQAVRNGLSVHTFATFLDYLSTMVFVSLRQKSRPDFSLIFLNNIAHLQHQFWSRSDTLHPEMELGIRLTDRMMGLILDSLGPDEAIIVMNGLKQRNVEGEGFHVYRQRNPQQIIERLGLKGVVEQCMTHDAHILCDSAEDADHAETVLRRCRLSDGHAAFYVERVSPVSVFYQIEFQHAVAPDASLQNGNQVIPLAELIELYAVRTGAHIPVGDVFARGLRLPAMMQNHEMYHHVLAHFGTHGAAAPARDDARASVTA